jgi:hypothetical protein
MNNFEAHERKYSTDVGITELEIFLTVEKELSSSTLHTASESALVTTKIYWISLFHRRSHQRSIEIL